VDFDGTMVAKKAIIGNPDKSHLQVEGNSFKLFYADETTPYVDFSDLRNDEGYAELT